jgi:hypothetical protein
MSRKCSASNEPNAHRDNNQGQACGSEAPVSMRVNSESLSTDIDESDLQYEKHDEQRI